MATEPRLVVALEARLNKFERDLQQAGIIADRQVRQIEDRFARANFGTNLLAGLIGGLSFERLLTGATRVLESLGKIADTAERVGLSAEQVQELRFALEQSGGSAAQADSGIERFANNVAKAATGAGYFGKVLEANNIPLRDSTGQLRSVSALLLDYANLIKRATDPAIRLNLATEAFGRGAGPAFAQALGKGADGLRQLGAEAQTAGAIISNDLIRQAAELDDEWQKTMATFSAATKVATVNAISAVRKFFSDYKEELRAFARLIDDFIANLPIPHELFGTGRQTTTPEVFVGPGGAAPEGSRFVTNRLGVNPLGGAFSFPGQAPRNTLESLFDRGTTPRPSAFGEGGATGGGNVNLPARGRGGAQRDAFERQAEQIERRRRVLEAETATLGQNEAARERARIEAELFTAAERAGIPVTAELTARIGKIADEFANTAARAELARDILQGTKEFGSALADAFKQAVIEGKNLDEVLKNLLNRLSGRAIDALFNAGFNALGGSLASSIVGPGGGFFGLPRAGGGPVSVGQAYLVGERGPEIFMPSYSGDIIPNAPRGGGLGGLSLSFSTAIDARGSNISEAQFRAVLAAERKNLLRAVKDALPVWSTRQNSLGTM